MQQNAAYSITSSACTIIVFWHVEAECLGSLEVDRQLEFGPSDDRQVSRFGTPKNATDVVAGLAKRFSKVGSITYKATGCDVLARL